ncbi:hypothetical protein NDU88_002131 [Pleurodeles waltl]|uniref:Uncharacterized protein n=1 Tax=Pleurodeles waltl TaxID=8319 RepID=A0AAV7PAR8_PLEWA|nr:hypothetical protein NDU88_002131 [Pleurodeles waltl]
MSGVGALPGEEETSSEARHSLWAPCLLAAEAHGQAGILDGGSRWALSPCFMARGQGSDLAGGPSAPSLLGPPKGCRGHFGMLRW